MTIADVLMFLTFGKGGGIEPTGTIKITENGKHDVKAYAKADVNVPQPSGLTAFAANGTYDVTEYAEGVVRVQSYKLVTMTVTDNRTTAGSWTPMLVPNIDSSGDLQGVINPIPGRVEQHSIPVLSYYRSSAYDAREEYRDTILYVFDCSVTAATGMTLINDPATEGYYMYELNGVDCSITIADKQ